MTPSFEVDIQDLDIALKTAEVAPFQDIRGPLDHVLDCDIGEYRRIEDGVIASIFSLRVLRPYDLHTIQRRRISFSFNRDGDYNIRLGRHSYATKPPMARMTIASESYAHHRPRAAPSKLAGVVVFVEPARLIDRFGLNLDGLPDEFKGMTGADGAQCSMEIALPPWSWIAVDQVLERRFSEPLRTPYIKAKVAELLCEAVAYLNLLDRPTNFRIPTAQREQTRIETAALIYRRDMRNPPSLRELALRLGLNRNKLNEGFREMFGLTPHEYSRRIRLEWAREQISAGALTISEACDAVGYSSHSAFTRAYGELFGHAPSETPGALAARKHSK